MLLFADAFQGYGAGPSGAARMLENASGPLAQWAEVFTENLFAGPRSSPSPHFFIPIDPAFGGTADVCARLTLDAAEGNLFGHFQYRIAGSPSVPRHLVVFENNGTAVCAIRATDTALSVVSGRSGSTLLSTPAPPGALNRVEFHYSAAQLEVRLNDLLVGIAVHGAPVDAVEAVSTGGEQGSANGDGFELHNFMLNNAAGSQNNTWPGKITIALAPLVADVPPQTWDMEPEAAERRFNLALQSSGEDPESWHSVCWAPALGAFSAVAFTDLDDRVALSPDGTTWALWSTTSGPLWSVCWSSEEALLVAVGAGIATSPDGEEWTTQTAPAGAWRSVCWSPDESLFVAVSVADTGAAVMTSPDGEVWTAQEAPASQWHSVCWSPDESLFVAVSISDLTANVMTSPDGEVWTAQEAPVGQWRSVCWSPALNLFVAVASAGDGVVMTSPDGEVWTVQDAAGPLWSVCWADGPGLLVAVGAVGVMTSPDGVAWTPQAAPTEDWRSVCWSPDESLLVAVASGFSTASVMTSPDGVTWTAFAARADTPDDSTYIIAPEVPPPASAAFRLREQTTSRTRVRAVLLVARARGEDAVMGLSLQTAGGGEATTDPSTLDSDFAYVVRAVEEDPNTAGDLTSQTLKDADLVLHRTG